jgi:hypothetical protein
MDVLGISDSVLHYDAAGEFGKPAHVLDMPLLFWYHQLFEWCFRQCNGKPDGEKIEQIVHGYLSWNV